MSLWNSNGIPPKAESNLRKHGVTFELATNAFYDPGRLEDLSAGDFDEGRGSVLG